MEQGWRGKNVQMHENLNQALNVINNRFNLPLKHWLKASKLIRYHKTQTRLDFWF